MGKNKIEDSGLNAVSEALKAERKLEPKGKAQYRIYTVETDPKTGKESFLTLDHFWAKDSAEAYEKLKKYKKAAGKGKACYYGRAGQYIGNTLSPDGKTVRYDSHQEMLEADLAAEPFWRKALDNMTWPFDFVCYKLQDLRTRARDVWSFIRTGHGIREGWSLDTHILDDLIHNIPKLIADRHGTPTEFCIKARAELHKGDKKFDAEKSYAEDPNSTEAEMDLARKMWDGMLKQGLLYAKLYKFYADYGIVDGDSPEDLAFEAEWSKTIPYYPGTYKEIDYTKLKALQDKCWNSLWNWFKLYGRELWD